jgi:hypothetical protein
MHDRDEAGTTAKRRLVVTIHGDSEADLARGLHEATIRLSAGEAWGSAADSACWVRWTTEEPDKNRRTPPEDQQSHPGPVS